jgi:hypothetical protein
MTHYERGRAREYRTMRLLRASGFECQRSAGSHGVWDVIGWNDVSVVFVQCKSEMPSLVEREQMERCPCPPNGVKLLHIWRKGLSLPEVVEVKCLTF